MADRVTIISPRDPWPFSTVTASDLEDLVGEGLLRPLTDEQRPEWIPPVGGAALSHPVLEGKPNANHVRARISYSRTQQLHNMDIITQCSK
jgi:hypothetical protein